MFQPLYDFVIIKKDPAEASLGRFLLAEQAKQKSTRGTVIAVGPGNLQRNTTDVRLPMACQVGDIVHWNEWRGMDFELDGEKLMVLHDDEIEAIELVK